MSRKGPPRLSVLRLGHRRDRDKRITSHLGLTARAFGADEVILAGDRDPSALETWDSVTERFGGDFQSRFEESPMSWLRKESKSGEITIVHLTMYGQNWSTSVPSISTDKPAVVVVGGTKVPAEVFHLADYNISVGNQPHSEVAALAVFLDSWLGSIDEESKFTGAQMKVIPSTKGKVVINSDED
ncbi:MAG TPA: tRNA (cytidine(56)-2'-O)-methyltransferase [Candidatus Thalassarchaeaceae archaeon]|nr:tRNA (cytidine(56)-2'-O)-methyltransferase [Candidatus Thalassarchaeaceae archaeon]